jgi:hypothetical protein
VAHALLFLSFPLSLPLFLSALVDSSDSVLTEADLMPYVPPQGSSPRSIPLSLAVTEFHFLLLYPTALVAQSRITGMVTNPGG